MTLSPEIVAAVDLLAPCDSSPRRVEAVAGRSRIALDLTHWGPVGLAFTQLDFCSDRETPLSGPQLREWGDRLAGRLRYLMEPVVVMEVDDLAGEAEMRSETPSVRDQICSFYEIRLGRTGSLRLRRVSFDAATRVRQFVPCQMTREALERLADDIQTSSV